MFALLSSTLGNLTFIPAMQAYLGDRLPYERRGRILAYTEFGWSLAFIGGVPLMGLAWWALDFPFMKRYSREQVARRPELAGRDIAATRRACERFRAIPVSIMNFVEGTRYTDAKHAAQQSPYRHLLKPKSGGVAFVIDAMGEGLQAILDVTIAYPAGRPTMLDLFGGRVREVRVDLRERPIPREFIGGDYQNDAAFRERFQVWMSALWSEKDALLDRSLKSPKD